MRKFYLSILLSLWIISNPTSAFTEEKKNDKINETSKTSREIEEKKSLELNDILFYTYENNDELKAEREKLNAVKTTKFRTFGENALPDIYLNSKRGRNDLQSDTSNQESKIVHDIHEDKIVLSQPIFKSGRTKTSLNAVDNEIQIQKNTLLSKEQNILFEAVNSTINILKTERIYKIVKQNEESLREGYEYSRVRRRVGKATVTEVFTAKSRYKDAMSDTASAKTDMLIAKANFKRIVGLDSSKINLNQIDSLFSIIDKDKSSQEEIIEKALTKNPDYLTIKENYQLGKNNLSFSKTDFLPTLTLNAGSTRGKAYNTTTKAMTRNTENFVNLNLRVPLVQSGVKYADYKSDKYSVNQSRFELKNAKKALIEQSVQTHEEFLLSKELIKTAEALRSATKIALDASVEESKVGKINIIDLLDRRREYFESQIEVIEAKSDNILKFYSLKVLMGEMVSTNLDNR